VTKLTCERASYRCHRIHRLASDRGVGLQRANVLALGFCNIRNAGVGSIRAPSAMPCSRETGGPDDSAGLVADAAPGDV
jgi:hypothetical protein